MDLAQFEASVDDRLQKELDQNQKLLHGALIQAEEERQTGLMAKRSVEEVRKPRLATALMQSGHLCLGWLPAGQGCRV